MSIHSGLPSWIADSLLFKHAVQLLINLFNFLIHAHALLRHPFNLSYLYLFLVSVSCSSVQLMKVHKPKRPVLMIINLQLEAK